MISLPLRDQCTPCQKITGTFGVRLVPGKEPGIINSAPGYRKRFNSIGCFANMDAGWEGSTQLCFGDNYPTSLRFRDNKTHPHRCGDCKDRRYRIDSAGDVADGTVGKGVVNETFNPIPEGREV